MSTAELVSQLGFPIAACIMMFVLYREERDAQREEREAFRQSLDELTKAFRVLQSDVRRAPALTDGGRDDGDD